MATANKRDKLASKQNQGGSAMPDALSTINFRPAAPSPSALVNQSIGTSAPAPSNPEDKQRIAVLEAEIARLNSQTQIFKRDGAIEVNGFQLTRRGLTVPDNASDDDFQQVGQFLFYLEDAIQLLIGDYLVALEKEYGYTYKTVAAQTGRSEKTLRNYKYVAGSVQLSLRRDNLNFGHYSLVAPMKPKDQKAWLTRASDGDWSISTLRTRIKDSQPLLEMKTLSPAQIESKAQGISEKSLELAKQADNASRAVIVAQLKQAIDEIEAMDESE